MCISHYITKHLIFLYKNIIFIIFSAIFKPSIALLTIPPAYPPPSPQGYRFDMLTLFKLSGFLSILTGEEVLVSTPVKIASLSANPFTFYPWLL